MPLQRDNTTARENQKEQIEDKEAQASQLSGAVAEMAQLGERRDSCSSDHRTLATTVEALDEDTRGTVEALQAQIGDLTAKVNVLMRAIGSTLLLRERDKRKQRHGVKKKGSIGDNGEIREEEVNGLVRRRQ